jgi:hypothetical protein
MTQSDADTLTWLGNPNCGLVGPYAFPFQWTFQRRYDRRHKTRRSAHLQFPLMKGHPLFIEAVAPPLKQIHHAAMELVDKVWDLVFFAGAHDPSILSALGVGAQWNLLQLIRPEQCPREGTRMLIEWVRKRFANRFAEWQATALRNGRYFPPPNRWELSVDSQGCVQLLMGWSAGFLPSDRVLAIRRVAEFTPGQSMLSRQACKVLEYL